jgi:hypothetical protein
MVSLANEKNHSSSPKISLTISGTSGVNKIKPISHRVFPKIQPKWFFRSSLLPPSPERSSQNDLSLSAVMRPRHSAVAFELMLFFLSNK